MKSLIKKISIMAFAVIMSLSLVTAFAASSGNDSPELNENVVPGVSAELGDDGKVKSPQTGDNSMDAAVLFLPVLCMVVVFAMKSTKKNLE